ncbi:MAG: hypothetical protein QOJ79_555 [Actinomycetota bacterium]|jgi:hypothetical protein|nr:hypothetical protein [Actinomycetota bacterium]
MTRRVPVVVVGTGAAEPAFRALLEQRSNDIAGVTGLLLVPVEQWGPEPSVIVNTGAGLTTVMAAVQAGHSAVTADLGELVSAPTDFAVLRADGRLGLSGALLPGFPLAQTLRRQVESGDVIESVEIVGPALATLVDEALAVSALIGVELRREDVTIPVDVAAAASWSVVVGHHLPVVRPASAMLPAPVRTVTVRSRWTGGDGLTLTGSVGGAEAVAGALLADLLALAREEDTPWRAHRRRTAAA